MGKMYLTGTRPVVTVLLVVVLFAGCGDKPLPAPPTGVTVIPTGPNVWTLSGGGIVGTITITNNGNGTIGISGGGIEGTVTVDADNLNSSAMGNGGLFGTGCVGGFPSSNTQCRDCCNALCQWQYSTNGTAHGQCYNRCIQSCGNG